jgi:hypothetical protein
VHLDPTTLLLFWFGGGCVIFLVWAAFLGEALMGAHPRSVRPAIGVLALLGLVHPAAGASAVDLVRLTRTLAEPPTDDPASSGDPRARQARAVAVALPRWAIVTVHASAAIGVVVAVIALIGADGAS